MDGLIGYDLFVFLSYVAFSQRKARVIGAQIAAFEEAFFIPGAWTLPALRSYMNRVNLPRHVLTPLFVLSWARYSINLLQRIAPPDAVGTGRIAPPTADALRASRYYRMWHHAVTNAHRLAWMNEES